LHQMNNRDPFMYKTADYGKTWKSISGDIPKSLHSYAHCVREDPVKQGMLYVGIENGVYFTTDDGQHWLAPRSALRLASVLWLTNEEHSTAVVVAPYGGVFGVLDNTTPPGRVTPQSAAAAAHLFPPRPASRFRPISEPMMMPDDAAEGRNPPE